MNEPIKARKAPDSATILPPRYHAYKSQRFFTNGKYSIHQDSRMQRILELVKSAKERYPEDSFFDSFENSCSESRLKREYYGHYECALKELSENDWEILKNKALNHFMDHREGQRKSGFFNQLNEVFAYRYLLKESHEQVQFIPEGKLRQPDISFLSNGKAGRCEVKSIGISDDEIARREGFNCLDCSIYENLSPEFIGKLEKTIEAAEKQVGRPSRLNLIFLFVQFDDFTHDFIANYQSQLLNFACQYPSGSLVIQFGLSNAPFTA